MNASTLLRRVVDALEAAAIPYMLVGSFASTWHGAPRTTQDIDIVIDPTPDGLDRLLADLGADEVYVSPSAHDTLAARDQFNVIDAAAGWKVDLIVRKDRAFSRTELSRRVPVRLLDVDTYAATAEDTILSKLEWAAASGSDRQLADAAAVIAVGGSRLDDAYLDHWAAELDITAHLAQARLAAAST